MDPRGERSRNVIANALRRLLAAQPFDEITVSEIVVAAGVSRSSFYAHFADKSELACHLLAPVMRGLANSIGPRRFGNDLQSVVANCLQDRTAILSALRSSARETIRRSIASEMLRSRVGAKQDCSSRIVATSIAEAQLMIIELSLSEHEPISGHYMAELIQQIAAGAHGAMAMSGFHGSTRLAAGA
jgi:AcrR family transcriptional regulator